MSFLFEIVSSNICKIRCSFNHNFIYKDIGRHVTLFEATNVLDYFDDSVLGLIKLV